MTKTSVDASTGNLIVSGKRIFPIGLSDPPPVNGVAPDSREPAWAEIASAGVSFVRNYTVWTNAGAAEQLLSVAQQLDAASKHGLQLWLALAGIDHDLSRRVAARLASSTRSRAIPGSVPGREPTSRRTAVSRSPDWSRCTSTSERSIPIIRSCSSRLREDRHALRTGHDTPLTAAAVAPYAAACDIHGVDIYPVSKPPGEHAGGPPVNTDISVVGDMTSIIARATRRKAIWMTLQISWSGVFPPHPVVLPTLQQARFMAYDAIVAGARGLFFFGGQFKQVMNAADRRRGWNWTYWRTRPAPAAPGADERRPLTGPDRTHLEPCRQGERRRHPAQCARGRRLPLPDRGAEKSDLHRHGALHRAPGRHHATAPCSHTAAATRRGR